MSTRAQELFSQLTDARSILSLIGNTEDAHLDCKEWPGRDDDAQRVFAKAACGLANADGGVLIVGMRAKTTSKEEPDVIESAAPVQNTALVKSRILDLVGQLVEPGIEGVQVREIEEFPGSSSGFVVVFIPYSDNLPKRSRKDWKFYLRIGSGTLPMEYFQIAEMFGHRPVPKLDLLFEKTGKVGPVPFEPGPFRFFRLGLVNTGRGIAKFPGIRFKREGTLRLYNFGIDGNNNHGLPLRPSESEWILFRGGVDDVIYPGTTLVVAHIIQSGSRSERQPGVPSYEPATLTAEISCEGMPSRTVEKSTG